jgi:small subunit ribosomal protein S8
MITDPIADMFVRIRNANAKLHEKVDIPSSKMKVEIAKILKAEGYIADFKKIEFNKNDILRIYLKFLPGGVSAIKGIKRISKSSLRVYKGYEEMPRAVSGLGITIVSTSRGLLTDKAAKREKVGGEIIGFVW